MMSAHTLSSETQALCAAAAARHAVTSAVHPEDLIFQFLYGNGVFPTKADAINYYFDDGARSARKVADHVARFARPAEDVRHVLEFASGYGAVTRHLTSALHGYQLASCDIHPEAIDFLSAEIGVPTVTSASSPDDFTPQETYDVVFALSFFSHMPRSTWSSWLARLIDTLRTDGILLFTTHGALSQQHFPQAELDQEGFWFEPQSEQHDLDGETYGSTITSKAFVDRAISLVPAECVFYEQGGWWDHQDLYILRRSGDPTGS